MQIKILGNKMDLTPSTKEYIETKMKSLEHLVTRFESQGEIIVHFELARTTRHHHKGEVFYAEATLHLPGKDIRAESYNAKAWAAVNDVKKTLKNDLARYKEKLVDRGLGK